MIVRELPDGQLLCINQTTHAMLAAAFCRHWGNRDFAPPTPFEPVLMAIAQHDCGWFEWEQKPQICANGYPMDFLHGPTGEEKLILWKQGIERVSAQHPYAGLLVGQHAAIMHAESLPLVSAQEAAAIRTFVDEQHARIDATRCAWQDSTPCGRALNGPGFEAHTRLLQFGDTASLQIAMPWASQRTFERCPLDQRGATATIRMMVDGGQITFDPWPYAIDSFEVSIHGKRLSGSIYADHEAYQVALSAAPYHHLTWTVSR